MTIADLLRGSGSSPLRDGAVSIFVVLSGCLVGALRKHGLSDVSTRRLCGILGLIALKIDCDYIMLPFVASILITHLVWVFSIRYNKPSFLVGFTCVSQVIILFVFDMLARLVDVEWAHRRAPFMMQAVRLHMMACNLANGMKDQEKLNEHQRLYAIKPENAPSLTESLCYNFFFPSVCFGPAIDFSEWRSFMAGPEAEKERPLSATARRLMTHRPQLFIRSRAAVALSDIVVGLTSILLWLVGQKTRFSMQYMASEDYLHESLFMRFVLIPFGLRFTFSGKYMFAWSLADAGITLSGFGQREGCWGSFRNIEPTSYLAPSFTDLNLGWNVGINSWLRDYVYVPLRASKYAAMMSNFVLLMTPFTVSALWHGSNWFFFVTLWFAALATQLSRECRHLFTTLERRVSHKVGRHTPAGFLIDSAYYIMSVVLAQNLYSFGTFFFANRGGEPGLSAAKNTYYVGYLLVVLSLFLPWGFVRRIFGIHAEEYRKLNCEEGWLFTQYRNARRAHEQESVVPALKGESALPDAKCEVRSSPEAM